MAECEAMSEGANDKTGAGRCWVCGKQYLYVQEGKVKICEIKKKIMEDVKYFRLIGNREIILNYSRYTAISLLYFVIIIH